jgi:hypothetical protein
MRISGFVVLVVCLLCTATAASAASSAVGACSCIGAEQGIPMHTGYSGYRTQYSRARATYGVQPRSVVVRRAPYQAAQAPRYRYGGRPIVQQPAVQYWTYQAQYPRVVRQAYRGQRRPVVDRRAPHRETQAPRYAYGGGQIVQHPADRRASNQEAKAPRYASGGGEIVQHQTDRGESNQEEKAPRYANASGQIVQHPAGCPARLFCGCGASIEAFGRSIRDLWLVSNWYRFPRTAPAAGMAVLWGTRHVAIIRQYNGDGTAVLYDANSGKGLTRVHRVRIAGLAVVDPHPGRTLPTPSPLMVIL